MPTVRVHHFPKSKGQPQIVREIIKEGPGLSQAEALELAVKAVEIYAGRHPRPPHVTISQAAAMIGRSRGTVAAMLSRYRIQLNACGQIPIESVDKLLTAPEVAALASETPEDRAAREAQELKEYQQENCRQLKAAVSRAIAETKARRQ
ncbi:hypothetical protein [Paraburkholderia heleia]|uniref:hypothetical protein n=1 Tax=Paraburkholderia heleia TaxID=634127 RepID=UPI00157A662D|nr:hypothetical protein [Paraburkholderia heleia]